MRRVFSFLKGRDIMKKGNPYPKDNNKEGRKEADPREEII